MMGGCWIEIEKEEERAETRGGGSLVRGLLPQASRCHNMNANGRKGRRLWPIERKGVPNLCYSGKSRAKGKPGEVASPCHQAVKFSSSIRRTASLITP